MAVNDAQICMNFDKSQKGKLKLNLKVFQYSIEKHYLKKIYWTCIA